MKKIFNLTKIEKKSLEERTAFLDEAYQKIPYRQRQWHVDNDNNGLVFCKQCNKNPVSWNVALQKYSSFCSSKCAQNSEETRAKIEKTCKKRYGAKSNLGSESERKKIEKIIQEKYGAVNPFKSEIVKQKIKKTNLERYGVENPSQNPLVMERIDKTNFERYRRRRKSQLVFDDETYQTKIDYEYMNDLYNNQGLTVAEIAKMIGVGHSELCKYFKNNFGFDLKKNYHTSQYERFVENILVENGIEFERSNRKILGGKEIDIFIPDLQTGIEIDGLFWHSEFSGGKDSKYHLEKTDLALSNGVRLIHVFDSEIEKTPSIVSSRVLSIIGKNEKIMARKTNVVEISSHQANVFVDKNHIQGKAQHSLALGLENDQGLVAVMTFAKSRYSRLAEWEIVRYCSSSRTNVIGGASKLLSHFVKKAKPKSIISYADRRWSHGNLYRTLGFKFHGNTNPNYWYTKDYRNLESRIKYQKHKLPSMLESFDPDLTEWENMRLNGFDRIWDCGSSRWILEL